MSKPHPLTGCSHLHGMAVEKPKKNRKKKHLDRLTRDAIAAQEAGMSYGKYKALHPHTPDEDEEEQAEPGGIVMTCAHCGMQFVKTGNQPAQRYCSLACQRAHSNAKNAATRKRKESGKIVTCSICGADFKTTAHNRKYCSTECYAEGQHRRNMERYRKHKEKAEATKEAKKNGST